MFNSDKRLLTESTPQRNTSRINKIFVNFKNDHISELLSNSGKNSKEYNVTDKPNKNDFRTVSKEAKKNLNSRFYFEDNLSHW